jgi:hypothetical protein
MYISCTNGHLKVAQWLFVSGATDDVRIKDKEGLTPMLAACQKDHLDVAKWLSVVGAHDDVRTPDKDGKTPMHVACEKGFLGLAQWLFESGAAPDIFTTHGNGITPLQSSRSIEVQLWLLLEGAANANDMYNTNAGHVDPAMVRREVSLYVRTALRALLAFIAAVHASFQPLLPLAVRFGGSRCPSPAAATTQKRSKRNASKCVLPLLRGHEDTLLALIADFVGVYRGRKLRNAREAYEAMYTGKIRN